ncbi:MAG TPA: KH domain-containing protein, partial [Leptolyngbyaceae cyanobacterium]
PCSTSLKKRMFSSNSVPNPDPSPNQTESSTNSPDFVGIVRFLVSPFLESSDSLSIDCEVMPHRAKVWIRVAFKEDDRGRVFGRGGRNIQAIRTVIEATAKLVNWSAHLDVYGEADHRAAHEHEGNGRPPSRGPSRSAPPRPRGRRENRDN